MTSRFQNVIGLFNGPLIAIQMTALQIEDKVSLVFTTVFDELPLQRQVEAAPIWEPIRKVVEQVPWTGSRGRLVGSAQEGNGGANVIGRFDGGEWGTKNRLGVPSHLRNRSWLFAVLLVAFGCVAPGQGERSAEGEPFVGEFRERDASVVALSLLTPGQGRHRTAAEVRAGSVPLHNDDQRGRYDALVQAWEGLDAEELGGFFKDYSFGVAPDDIERVYSPKDGVVVIRDRSAGVPHVYGRTRADVAFGAGYVQAEDRLFSADLRRHMGRGRLSELLGATPENLATDRSVRLHADFTEEELEAQLGRMVERHGELGALVVEEFEASAAGFNAYLELAAGDPQGRLPAEYAELGVVPKPWTASDLVAVSVSLSWAFGGGARQLANADLLAAIEARGHSPEAARAIYDEFRHADDAEAPATTQTRFPLNVDLGPIDPAAAARPDPPPAQLALGDPRALPGTVDGPFGPIVVRPWPGVPTSNWLTVTAKLSATGRPISVGGPQIGYADPSALMEVDLHGPGIHVRGAAGAGLPTLIGIGHGVDYGWTGTSPAVDQGDIRAVKLCDPDGKAPELSSTHYLRDGVCRPMQVRTDSWVDPGGHRVEMTTERTEVGIVQRRGTVSGEPVAFTLQRAAHGIEVEFAVSFVDIVDPEKTKNAFDIQRALARGSFAGNFTAFDSRDVVYITSGTVPKLARGVDRDLPFWGDSRWDWVGLLSFDEHPQEVNPERGFSTNWNNRQAPGFATDSFPGSGSVQRVELLDAAIVSKLADDGKVDVVELIQAAEEAGTRDLRGVAVLPMLLEAVGTPDDPRQVRAVELLAQWHATGCHRRDLDLDGDYEQASAVAVMDRWFPLALDAVFGLSLGDLVGILRLGTANLDKDLRKVLGHPVLDPYSRGYCGGGDPALCRTRLLAALDGAVASLEADFGSDPARWDADEESDRIRYGSGETGHRQDRSTFQQILEFRDRLAER